MMSRWKLGVLYQVPEKKRVNCVMYLYQSIVLYPLMLNIYCKCKLTYLNRMC